MAKIKVCGEVMILTSTVKLADIQRLEKTNPDVLAIKDAEGNEVFRVATGDTGKITTYAAVFSGETRDERKLATLTMGLPESDDDIREVIADAIGGSIAKISEVEKKIAEILPVMNRERADLIASIEVS